MVSGLASAPGAAPAGLPGAPPGPPGAPPCLAAGAAGVFFEGLDGAANRSPDGSIAAAGCALSVPAVSPPAPTGGLPASRRPLGWPAEAASAPDAGPPGVAGASAPAGPDP